MKAFNLHSVHTGIVPEPGMGYRITALVATAFCLLGGLVFLRYDERGTIGSIESSREGA